MLRTHGHNTVAIAVIGEDAAGDGLGKVTLDARGNHTTPLRYADIASPGWSAADRDPRAAADVRITAPDSIARGAAGEVTASFAPRRATARDASLTMRLPDGWTAATPLTQPLGDVPAGRTVTRTWKVTAAGGSGPWSAVLSATAGYRGGTASAAGGRRRPPPHRGPGARRSRSRLHRDERVGGRWSATPPNGEDAAGCDGRPMSIAGVPYAKGLGVHADGDVTVFLGGGRALAVHGVGGRGRRDGRPAGWSPSRSWRTGCPVATTAVLRGRQAATPLAADVSGAQVVDLVVTDGGDGNGLDHADWADARLTCA